MYTNGMALGCPWVCSTSFSMYCAEMGQLFTFARGMVEYRTCENVTLVLEVFFSFFLMHSAIVSWNECNNDSFVVA